MFQKIQNRIDNLRQDIISIRINGFGPANILQKFQNIREMIDDAYIHNEINTFEYFELKNILNELQGI